MSFIPYVAIAIAAADDDHRALRPPHPDYGLGAPYSRRVHTAAAAWLAYLTSYNVLIG